MEQKDIKILYEARHGSHAYGLNTPESDEDFKGFCVGPKKIYTGFLDKFEQYEDSSCDRDIYEIRKFFHLAANCNPSIIEILFVEPEDIITCTKSGELVLENRDLFVSKKARHTFMGYAFAQLKRIRTHRHWLLNPIEKKPERSDFGLPEQKLVSPDHQGAFLYVLSGTLKDTLEESKLSTETISELKNVNWVGLCQHSIPNDYDMWHNVSKITNASDNFVEAMMKEKAYTNAYNEWKSYNNWKENRNPKRAKLEKECLYDAKHASHLVRLAKMGKEILSGKGVIVKRPDRKELLAIKNGEWSFEQVEEFAKDLDTELEELYKTSSLPHSPNRKKLNNLCMKIIEREVMK